MSNLFNFEQVKGKWHKFPSFNLGGGAKLYKNIAQKLLTVSLCMAMVLLGVPRGQNFVAEAADVATIPNTMFLTKEALLELCAKTNVVDGKPTGLLATGTDTDVTLRISFGTRPGEVKYYTDYWTLPSSVGTASTPTPLTWLVSGSDATDALVLFSEAPLIGCDDLSSASLTSVFQVDSADRVYSAPADSGYATAGDISVYASHWGESNLRDQLTALASNPSYFKSAEQGLMATSTVSTVDTKNAVTYTTDDILYAPRLIATDYSSASDKSVTVGSADSLAVALDHWVGASWLRSPDPHDAGYALIGRPRTAVDSRTVSNNDPAISAAFRLTLSSVLFTSAASAAPSTAGGSFKSISADTPMTLRLDAPAGSAAEVGAVGGTIGTKAAAGWTLMVQGVTADGQNWSYSKAIDSDDVVRVSAADVALAGSIELSSFDNCEVWLEQPVPDGGALTYALRAEATLPTPDPAPNPTPDPTPPPDPAPDSPPADTPDASAYLETTVTVKGKQQRIRVYDPHQVLPIDAQLKVEAVTSHEDLDDTHEIEHLLAYNISLLDANGDALPMPLSDKVELCFEVVAGLDKEDLEVVLVQLLDDFEFSEELVELDGATWVKVQTDHFSPYALLDKLSPEEKGVQVQDNSAPKNNVKTGDIATQITAAGLGMMLVLALGVMLRLITNKRKFEE